MGVEAEKMEKPDGEREIYPAKVCSQPRGISTASRSSLEDNKEFLLHSFGSSLIMKMRLSDSLSLSLSVARARARVCLQ